MILKTDLETEQGEALLTQEPVLDLKASKQRFMSNWSAIACSSLVSLAIGYLIGLGKVPQQSNKAQYGLPQSEAAWASIIPVGRGFVHHADVAPFISNIAVFHQLHCLHAIIIAYYKVLESPAVTNFTDIPDFEINTSTRIAPFHIRHCFDYIRQALMCGADTNLEVLDR
ncbi:uncharacterized protein PG986_009315 [Apiospora aurea]|uniref:Uncharacterized protein n=1 Tax=Apiospora aurea TaxID=335848 RepID=A0ABR1Q7E1_9PEZI